MSDLYSPVDGEVVAVNAALADNLEHLADDPYGPAGSSRSRSATRRGWRELLDEAAYKKQCEEEPH